jgi:hypothetical protein
VDRGAIKIHDHLIRQGAAVKPRDFRCILRVSGQKQMYLHTPIGTCAPECFSSRCTGYMYTFAHMPVLPCHRVTWVGRARICSMVHGLVPLRNSLSAERPDLVFTGFWVLSKATNVIAKVVARLGPTYVRRFLIASSPKTIAFSHPPLTLSTHCCHRQATHNNDAACLFLSN